jgi:hypothetical protein
VALSAGDTNHGSSLRLGQRGGEHRPAELDGILGAGDGLLAGGIARLVAQAAEVLDAVTAARRRDLIGEAVEIMGGLGCRRTRWREPKASWGGTLAGDGLAEKVEGGDEGFEVDQCLFLLVMAAGPCSLA